MANLRPGRAAQAGTASDLLLRMVEALVLVELAWGLPEKWLFG